MKARSTIPNNFSKNSSLVLKTDKSSRVEILPNLSSLKATRIALGSSTRLEIIDNKGLSSKQLANLLNAITLSKITTVKIRSTNFTMFDDELFKDGEILFKSFENLVTKSDSLTSLDLSNNALNFPFLEILATGLKSNNLSSLNLAGTCQTQGVYNESYFVTLAQHMLCKEKFSLDLSQVYNNKNFANLLVDAGGSNNNPLSKLKVNFSPLSLFNILRNYTGTSNSAPQISRFRNDFERLIRSNLLEEIRIDDYGLSQNDMAQILNLVTTCIHQHKPTRLIINERALLSNAESINREIQARNLGDYIEFNSNIPDVKLASPKLSNSISVNQR